MYSETPVWKYTAVAAAVIVACFFIGYFILGPSAARPTSRSAQDASDQPATVTISDTPAAAPQRPVQPAVKVEERTEQVEEEKRRKEEAAKKEEQKAEERRKKEDAEEKSRKQETSPAPAASDENDAPAAEPAEQNSDAPNSDEPRTAPDESAPSRPDNDSQEIPAPRETSAELHRVRVGSFEDRNNAQNLARELNGRGYATYMEPEQVNGKTIYRIQVGAFRDEKQAREKQKELRDNGYEATIATSH